MDVHMHLDLYKKHKDIVDYAEKNSSYTIAVTNLPDLYKRYFQSYQGYTYVKIALGFHPELVLKYQNQINMFLEYIDTTRYIGEVGLDFTIQDENIRKAQINVFSEIVDAVSKYKNKLLTVHSRKAERECLKVLERFQGKVILHWYSGNIQVLKEAINRSYFFSINQQMLLSQNGRKIINSIPIDKILIESDAPFTKGLEKEYSLFFIEKIYNYLSSTRNINERTLSAIIKNNLKKALL